MDEIKALKKNNLLSSSFPDNKEELIFFIVFNFCLIRSIKSTVYLSVHGEAKKNQLTIGS